MAYKPEQKLAQSAVAPSNAKQNPEPTPQQPLPQTASNQVKATPPEQSPLEQKSKSAPFSPPRDEAGKSNAFADG